MLLRWWLLLLPSIVVAASPSTRCAPPRSRSAPSGGLAHISCPTSFTRRVNPKKSFSQCLSPSPKQRQTRELLKPLFHSHDPDRIRRSVATMRPSLGAARWLLHPFLPACQQMMIRPRTPYDTSTIPSTGARWSNGRSVGGGVCQQRRVNFCTTCRSLRSTV